MRLWLSSASAAYFVQYTLGLRSQLTMLFAMDQRSFAFNLQKRLLDLLTQYFQRNCLSQMQSRPARLDYVLSSRCGRGMSAPSPLLRIAVFKLA